MLLISNFAMGQELSTYQELLARYRCPVVDRLEQIYGATDTADPQNWFLIISFAAHPHDYVQCVFDTRTRMLCEAASGFYEVATKPRTRWLPGDSIAALGRLGFSTDGSGGNFKVWFDVAEPPNLGAIAEFMLKSLHNGFAARANDTLQFDAPLAPRATRKCVAVN
jgi:hypothetical protein